MDGGGRVLMGGGVEELRNIAVAGVKCAGNVALGGVLSGTIKSGENSGGRGWDALLPFCGRGGLGMNVEAWRYLLECLPSVD